MSSISTSFSVKSLVKNGISFYFIHNFKMCVYEREKEGERREREEDNI